MPGRSADPLDAVIGRNIRVHRMRMGFSQAALVSAIGVSYQQIQKYEEGRNRISAVRLYRAGPILGIPIGDFFFPADTFETVI